MEIINVTTEEELKRCLAIRMEVFVVEQKVPSDLEVDELDTLDAPCRHLLLTHEGEDVATGRWKQYEPGVAKLQRIAVHKAFRGQGNGEKIVLGMEKDAKEQGMKESILDAQCHAEGFYSKLGYVTISTEPFDDAGIPHVRMKKVL